MQERLNKWIKRIVVTLVVILPAGGAVTFLAVEVSSQPRFCGGCHNMRSYYESWKDSSHHEVACVECHIPPGVRSEVQKKVEALSMVASYFTGTYATKPWGEVVDESCQRSGCHTKRVLLSRELYKGVLFDHRPHLVEMRRGKQLRCTSCHSQIVQGTHIAVTSSTCALCHFKNTGLNEGTGRCTLCHEVPEERITTAGLSFDHGDVKRFGMNCTSCHEGVVKGNGEVPRERCYTCHNRPERLARYGETESLHRTHITEHTVECLDCHIEIQHGIPAREEALAAACESCHSPAAGHSAVRDLYRGIAAKDVEPRPAPMYLAGIRCEACHDRWQNGNSVANEVGCMACHGPAYLTIYRTWQVGLQERMTGMSKELQAAKGRLESAGHTAEQIALADTQANIALLQQGRAVHNPGYALAILRKAHQDVSAALQRAGEEPPPPPWIEAPYQTECLDCHFGVEYIAAPAFGQEFPHMPHTVSAGLRCTVCHAGTERHGELELQGGDCANCHAMVAQPMAGVDAEDCLGCHTADIGPVSEKVRVAHDKHIAAGFPCDICHLGVADIPHLEFAGSPDAVPVLGHEFCATCHGGDVLAADGSMPEDANCEICHESF